MATLLAIPQKQGVMFTQQIPADYAYLPIIREQFASNLKECGMDINEVNNWMMVFSEAVTNAIEHGAKGNSKLELLVEWQIIENLVEVIVMDPGLGVAEGENDGMLNVRGYGLTLMRHFCDTVQHWINPAGGHVIRLNKTHPNLSLKEPENKSGDLFRQAIEEFYATLKMPLTLNDRLDGLFAFLKAYANVQDIEIRLIEGYSAEELACYRGKPPCERCQSCRPLETKEHLCMAMIGSGPVNCFPLVIGHKSIGSMAVVMKSTEVAKSHDLKHMETVAHCVALAIEENRQSRKKELNLEAVAALKSAAQLQNRQRQFSANSALIYGKTYGFEERAESVAGDVVECFPTEDGSAYLLVADVMGKGVAAAFLGGIFRGAWHLLAARESHPLVLLRELNRFLYDELNKQTMFVTVALAYIDAKNKKLSVINAGHTAVYLQDKNGKLRKIEGSGAPLGLFEDNKYQVEIFDLKSFERLLMPTDGAFLWDREIGEPSAEKMEEFMIENAGITPEELWKKLQERRREAPRDLIDDMSLLLWEKNKKA